MSEAEQRRTQRIRTLNDALRCRHKGGRIMLTDGIAALPSDVVAGVLRAVQAFDAFTPDNDPYGEHDCAVIEHCVHRVIWKIDYYDRMMVCGSPDPADPAVTTRVLTIMLAHEY